MSFPSIIQRIQHVQNYFKDPHIVAKGILEYYFYFFTPKISQDSPKIQVIHKENNV